MRACASILIRIPSHIPVLFLGPILILILTLVLTPIPIPVAFTVPTPAVQMPLVSVRSAKELYDLERW